MQCSARDPQGAEPFFAVLLMEAGEGRFAAAEGPQGALFSLLEHADIE